MNLHCTYFILKKLSFWKIKQHFSLLAYIKILYVLFLVIYLFVLIVATVMYLMNTKCHVIIFYHTCAFISYESVNRYSEQYYNYNVYITKCCHGTFRFFNYWIICLFSWLLVTIVSRLSSLFQIFSAKIYTDWGCSNLLLTEIKSSEIILCWPIKWFLTDKHSCLTHYLTICMATEASKHKTELATNHFYRTSTPSAEPSPYLLSSTLVWSQLDITWTCNSLKKK